MNQRTGKAVMFHTNQDRAFFSSQLSVLEARFGLEIDAYVLMGNHYHVLARSSNIEPGSASISTSIRSREDSG